MEKLKVAVVSSYNIPCGIAQYIEHLEPHLGKNKNYEIKVVPIPVAIFRSNIKEAKISAKKALSEMLETIRNADIVNIQFEPGLYGLSPFTIWKRLRLILSASKKSIITYHSVPQLEKKRLEFSLKEIPSFIRSYRHNYIYNKLFKYIKSRAKDFVHIVQTQREKFLFTLIGLDKERIFEYPLAFISEEQKEEFQKNAEQISKQMKSHVSCKKLMGVFGFLAEYKGIEVAISALKHLPEDWSLAVIGGLHLESIEIGNANPQYINKILSALLKEYKGNSSDDTQRVFFSGAVTDKEFNEWLVACDVVVFPYAEVGQTSSGPVAIALDLNKDVYCTRNKCFLQLEKFSKGMLSFFEIGNYVELAQKIKKNDGENIERKAAREHYRKRFNVEGRANIYHQAIEFLKEKELL